MAGEIDPGPCCCEYGDFYEREGLMPPIHDCPAPAPLQLDDLDDPTSDYYIMRPVPLTPLEIELAKALDFSFGVASGKIIDCRGRW